MFSGRIAAYRRPVLGHYCLYCFFRPCRDWHRKLRLLTLRAGAVFPAVVMLHDNVARFDMKGKTGEAGFFRRIFSIYMNNFEIL